jgi:hypothetical protein
VVKDVVHLVGVGDERLDELGVRDERDDGCVSDVFHIVTTYASPQCGSSCGLQAASPSGRGRAP